MSGSFLDTTIVVDLTGDGPGKAKANTHISAHPPGEACFYALRELLAGHVQILCDAHNALHAAENGGEAILAILRRSKFEGRKREAKIQEIAAVLSVVFNDAPGSARGTVKREALSALAMKAVSTWRKAQKLRNVALVQRLGCFNGGQIGYGEAKELRGPRNTFECISSERCAAAGYLYDNKESLRKMSDALHPSKLDAAVANKRENSQRRKAIKELLANGPLKFNKTYCRALGDAYFVAMCPPGSDILTTNLVDFEPLCEALGKVVILP